MSDQHQLTEDEQGNGKADAIGTLVIITTVVVTAVFWLLGQ